MGEVYCKEKPTVEDVKDYINNLAKQYEIEKLFDRNKIFIKKESEYVTVDRIIKRLKQTSYIEYDTIFKLYKLQRYSIDEKYFKGSVYKLHTLNSLKSFIRSCTLDSSISIINNKFKDNINSFINEIKLISKPFSGNLVNEKRKKIDSLIKCGSLSTEDINFINSEIERNHLKKHKKEIIITPVNIIKEKIVKEKIMNNENNENKLLERFRIMVRRYKEGSDVLTSLFPDLSKKSIDKYLTFIKKFERDGKVTRIPHCPTALEEAWLEYKTDPNIKMENIQTEQRNYSKLQKFSNNDFNVLIDNYTLPLRQLFNLLPKLNKRTITNYCGCLKNLDKGKEKSPSLPIILYDMWKEKNQNKPSTNVINTVEKQNSVNIPCEVIKPVVNDSSTVKIEKYVLIQNGIEIIRSNNKDYIQGYKDALIHSIQIYQIND